jgi:hypothetical protein
MVSIGAGTDGALLDQANHELERRHRGADDRHGPHARHADCEFAEQVWLAHHKHHRPAEILAVASVELPADY